MSAPEGLAFEPFVDDGGNIGIRLNQEVVVYTPEEQAQIRAEFEWLSAENAKLRELLADTLMQPRDYCQKYGIEYESWDSANDHLDARMRELGVDVP